LTFFLLSKKTKIILSFLNNFVKFLNKSPSIPRRYVGRNKKGGFEKARLKPCPIQKIPLYPPFSKGDL